MIINYSRVKDWDYIYVLDSPDNIISIFDELRYDRSDIDMLSPAMRKYASRKLNTIGFKQVSGNEFFNKENDIKCIIPKFHALGSSPFDITRYLAKRKQDYYILTPTQVACKMIEAYELDEAVEHISILIKQQPVNLLKVLDYLEYKEQHKKFSGAIPYLTRLQKEIITNTHLKHKKSLG